MVDYINAISPEHTQQSMKSDVVRRQEEFEAQSKDIRTALENEEVKSLISTHDNSKNRDILIQKFKLEPSSFEVLYEYGQFQFSCGNYTAAAEYLYHYRLLATDSTKLLSSQWGVLASNILKGSFEDALNDFNGLRETIDRQQSQDKGTVVQLQQRTWLLHCGLFIFFNHDQGRDLLVDVLSHTAYLNTLQTACPWLLRYYAIAVIVTSRHSQRQKSLMRDLVKVVSIEKYQYADPLTKFVDALYTDFDFSEVEKQLKEIDAVFAQDFFLASHPQLKEVFFNNARFYTVEAYCRIHSHVTVAEVAQKVGLASGDFVQWVQTEDKFVVDGDSVYIPHDSQNVISGILDRSAALAVRSHAIKSALEHDEYPPTPSDVAAA